MTTSFVRQLGPESGVQLNPLRDNSEIPAGTNDDQIFAIAMRATRGRIDKPFKVNRGDVLRKLGKGEQIRLSALNEATVHVSEALNSGAYEAVVHRLTVEDDPVISWVVLAIVEDGGLTFSVKDALPSTYIFAVRHLECFNDGISVEFRADEKRTSGVLVPNDKITVRLRDKDGVLLFEFYGSLDPDAKDDYGNSAFLEDVVASQTDVVEFSVGA